MTATQDIATYELFVDGRSQPAADGATFERLSPSDGTQVGRYAMGHETDVDNAVRAARRAFDETTWPTLSAGKRAAILRRTAELLRDRSETIGLQITRELGKPRKLARTEVLLTADVFEYYAALVLDVRSDLISRHDPNAIGLVLQEPVGVVAAITPWNFPLLLLSWKVAPALAAGCTVVSKPASTTPGSALDLAGVLQDAGLPAGVYNVVTGDGAELGAALVSHPGVDKVAFTGSTEVGRQVMVAASGTMKKVTLELGGKSPNIVFADADLDAAVRGAYWGIFLNTGQACQAGSRLLVQEEIHDEFLSRLAEMTARSRVGDPMLDDTMIGPLVDPKQLNTVMSYIAAGVEDGATLAAGGNRLTGPGFDDGHYVEPTIFDDVSGHHRIAREEIFGPVLAISSFRTPADAIRDANDSRYGLAAAVWTRDLDRSLRTVKALRAGTVWINAYHDAGLPFCMPMGGYKQSGIGRELGREGLAAYFETKSVHLRINHD
jgi:acyl-CoA reductase-like NAD-dependent aldehyde dehydrogenase